MLQKGGQNSPGDEAPQDMESIESVCQITDYRQILRYELAQRQGRNPGYSLRAFARDLRVSVSMLSDVLNGKHGFSARAANKVAAAMDLRPHEAEYFCDLVECTEGRTEEARAAAQARLRKHQEHSAFTEMQLDAFHVVADWYHMAILDLMAFSSFRDDPQWIAKHLKITAIEAQEALLRLLRLGMIQRTSDGLRESTKFSQVGQDTPSAAIRRFHEQMLLKARQALLEQHVDDREFTTAVVPIAAEDMPRIKARIREFQRDLILSLARVPKKNRLCTFAIQFFKICDEESLH